MHISFPSHRLDQRGDTIVEVLIALAIISTVLAGAFFVTNRSSQNVRDTEEHTQALQLLQGQIEQLRAEATTPGTTVGSFTNFFCYDATTGNRIAASSSSDYSKCPDDLSGSSGVPYQFVIEMNGVVGSTTLFTASVQWDGLHGQTNTEQLLYKVALAP